MDRANKIIGGNMKERISEIFQATYLTLARVYLAFAFFHINYDYILRDWQSWINSSYHPALMILLTALLEISLIVSIVVFVRLSFKRWKEVIGQNRGVS